MKKSSIVTLSAVLLSLFFCVVYFGLFARISSSSSPQPDQEEILVNQPQTLQPTPTTQSIVGTTLFWVQVGAFAKDSSVDELVTQLKADSFEPITYIRGDYKVVVVAPSLDYQVTLAAKQKLISLDYEWMEKSTALTAEQLTLVSNHDYQSLMEGLQS